MPGRPYPAFLDGFPAHPVDGGGVPIYGKSARLQAGHYHQLLDEINESVGIPIDALQVLPLFRGF